MVAGPPTLNATSPPRPRLYALPPDGRGARLLRQICRRRRRHPPGPAARLARGREGHGRLCQRQDRLPRPATTVRFSSRETWPANSPWRKGRLQAPLLLEHLARTPVAVLHYAWVEPVWRRIANVVCVASIAAEFWGDLSLLSGHLRAFGTARWGTQRDHAIAVGQPGFSGSRCRVLAEPRTSRAALVGLAAGDRRGAWVGTPRKHAPTAAQCPSYLFLAGFFFAWAVAMRTVLPFAVSALPLSFFDMAIA